MIECVGLLDGDLPSALEKFSGHYERLVIYQSNFTVVESNSIPADFFVDILYINSNKDLKEIKSGFMQDISQYQSVLGLGINGNSKLK